MFDPSAIAPDLRAPGDVALARIEEAGLNAAQPPEQLLVDGWLLRFAPGKARRARSVNAICAGRLDLKTKIDLCRHWYARFRLPLLFRITPFSQPAGLDEYLASCGFVAFDETRVMTRAVKSAEPHIATAGVIFQRVDVEQFAAVVGQLRASLQAQVRAHERRLLASTLRETTIRYVAYSNDRAVAAGQTVVEGDLAGLYDIVTATDARGQGLGTGISRWLLAAAEERGAGTAYLQVDAGNAAARSIYAKLGFVDRYAYWYRRPAGVVGELQI